VPGVGGIFATRPDADLPVAPLTGQIVDSATVDPTGLVCRVPAAGNFEGKIVLILRGDCFFETKLINARNAGAIGAIIYTNDNPIATIWDIGAATLPAVMVTNEHGLKIKQAISDQHDLTVKIFFDLGTVTLAANQMASFSSRGPGVGNNIHVDLVAPGEDIFLVAQKGNDFGEIYSSTGYAVEGGTSFSSPMVAGAAAVVKAARPGLKMKQYKLVNTAAPFARADGAVFGVQSAGRDAWMWTGHCGR
jgi:subtilisin family serine protease